MSGHASEVENVDVTRQATGGLAAAIYERRRPRGFISLDWTGRHRDQGWVDPWVGSGWVEIFQFFCVLGWVHYSKSTKHFRRACF